MDELTNSLPTNIFDELKKIILDIGYTDFVVNDDIQAYISTGLYSSMEDIEGVSSWKDRYRKVLDKHLKTGEILENFIDQINYGIEQFQKIYQLND